MLAKWTGFIRTVAMLVMISWIILEPGKAVASETIKDDPDGIIDQVEKDVEFRYKARLTGVNDQSLLVNLQSASQLVTLEARPPPSLVALERRATARTALTKTYLTTRSTIIAATSRPSKLAAGGRRG